MVGNTSDGADMQSLEEKLAEYEAKHKLCCEMNDDHGRMFWSGAVYALRKLIHAEQSKTVEEPAHV